MHANSTKGQELLEGAVTGALVGPLAVLMYFRKPRPKCPHCQGWLRHGATVCPQCRRDVA